MEPILDKEINEMTVEEFMDLPHRPSYDYDIGEFDSLIVLPMDSTHESGYRRIDFVACLRQFPICRLAGCCDIIDFGSRSRCGNYPCAVEPIGWSMDCLPVSGLLRIFCAKKITISSAISSMYVFVPEIIEYTVHGEVATELTKSGKSRIYDHRHDPGYTDEEEKIRFVDL